MTTALQYKFTLGGYHMEMHHNATGSDEFIYAHQKPLVTIMVLSQSDCLW